MYLWGFIYRAGQDIDAMFLIQGCLFVLAIVPRKWNTDRYPGYVYSSVLLIFVFYYFFSGVNKIIDLSILEWFQFELFNINKSMLLAEHELKYHAVFEVDVPDLFLIISNYVGAAATYLVHLGAPLLFLYRTKLKLFLYWLFYSIFHILSGFVGILFTANFFIWLVIIPIFPSQSKNRVSTREADKEIYIIYDGECPFCSDFVMASNLRNRYKNLKIVNAREKTQLSQNVIQQGYDLNEGMVVIKDNKILFGTEAARFIALNGSGGLSHWFYKSMLYNQAIANYIYPVLVVLRKRYLKLVGKGLI